MFERIKELRVERKVRQKEIAAYLHIAQGTYSDYENGKIGRVELSAYATKTNRRKLTGAYSDKCPLAAILPLREETEIALYSTDGRALVFSSALLAPKSSRATQGVGVMSLKGKHRLEKAKPLSETPIQNLPRYRVRSLPAAGALLREEDRGEEQMNLL